MKKSTTRWRCASYSSSTGSTIEARSVPLRSRVHVIFFGKKEEARGEFGLSARARGQDALYPARPDYQGYSTASSHDRDCPPEEHRAFVGDRRRGMGCGESLRTHRQERLWPSDRERSRERSPRLPRPCSPSRTLERISSSCSPVIHSGRSTAATAASGTRRRDPRPVLKGRSPGDSAHPRARTVTRATGTEDHQRLSSEGRGAWSHALGMARRPQGQGQGQVRQEGSL